MLFFFFSFLVSKISLMISLVMHIFLYYIIATIFINLGFNSFNLFPFQYARLVREALCELELPYVLHNIGEGSTRMRSLLNVSGSDKVYFQFRFFVYGV